MKLFKHWYIFLFSLLFLLVLPFVISFSNTNTAYAGGLGYDTSAYFNFQNYVQSTNMVNPTNILNINTSDTGTSTNCLSHSCWSIRVSNPNVSGIPANATIIGARFIILGTGTGGYLQVLIGQNSTYCLTSPYVGDISTVPKDSNGGLTSSNYFFSNCVSNSFPNTVNDLSNFFLEINAPKDDMPTFFTFINPQVAFDYTIQVPSLTPTPTPTPTPTLIPTPIPGPVPFLDLPWDYGGKGLSFNEAALSINSYFDHEYPLLSGGLGEPQEAKNTLTTFRGAFRTSFEYSSHDGYDYGNPAQVHNGDPVLAAADGCASYNLSSAGGNVIEIDHGNYYQTRYLHLQDTGLITKETTSCVNVTKGQMVGRVGATGNVSPSGILGAHIHFGVFEDKNKDGSFEDNIPDGVTDPFGWQSREKDPWETYTFFYNGKNRTGNRSYYLWKKKIDKLDATLTANGGVFNTGRYKVEFPQDATSENLTLNILSEPIVKLSKEIQSIGSTITVTAKDALGNLVTTFKNLFTITVDFSSFDLSKYNTNTLSLYSSADGISWTKEPTIIDYINNTATTQIDHLTHFALLAERRDTMPPTTTATPSGEQGQANWFRSDVAVTLNSEDNTDGLGVDYTLYKIEDNENTTDWATYKTPLTFTADGHHKIQFYSVDKDENVETVKSVEFDIDKTIPEAKIFVDQAKQGINVEGIDQNQTTVERLDNANTKKKDDALYIVTDQAGNAIRLDVRDRDKERKDRFKIYSIQYNQDAPIDLSDNHYNISYKGKKDKLNVSEQNFEIKGEIKIRIKYNSKKNQSIIITRVDGNERTKEIRDGIILLQVTTEKGTLRYSY